MHTCAKFRYLKILTISPSKKYFWHFFEIFLIGPQDWIAGWLVQVKLRYRLRRSKNTAWILKKYLGKILISELYFSSNPNYFFGIKPITKFWMQQKLSFSHVWISRYSLRRLLPWGGCIGWKGFFKGSYLFIPSWQSNKNYRNKSA